MKGDKANTIVLFYILITDNHVREVFDNIKNVRRQMRFLIIITPSGMAEINALITVGGRR